MKMMIRSFGCAVLAGLLATGCSRTSSEETVFTVNGQAYSLQDLAREVDFNVAVHGLRPRKAMGLDEEGFRQRASMKVLASKVDELLMLRHVADSGVEADPTILEGGKRKFAALYGGKRGDFEDLRRKLDEKGGFGADLVRRLEDEAKTETFLRRDYGRELAVDDAQVESTLASMRRGDERARATNAVIYATASNVWRRAAGGGDFAALAKRYSMATDDAPGGDLGDRCDASDFSIEEPSVWAAVSALRPGGVTPLLDTSEGLAVYKCLARTESAEAQGGAFLHLARILFRRALLFENHDPQFVRRELTVANRRKVVAGLMSNLVSRATIEAGPAAARTIPSRLDGHFKTRYGMNIERKKVRK